MIHHEQGMVDLLEIYHARQLQGEVLANLRRLRVHDPLDPFQDPVRKRDVRSYYEAVLITMAALLEGLGDDRSSV